jgi:hypothetical protein
VLPVVAEVLSIHNEVLGVDVVVSVECLRCVPCDFVRLPIDNSFHPVFGYLNENISRGWLVERHTPCVSVDCCREVLSYPMRQHECDITARVRPVPPHIEVVHPVGDVKAHFIQPHLYFNHVRGLRQPYTARVVTCDGFVSYYLGLK